MTKFELLYCIARPFEHALYQHVHRELISRAPKRLLDVGGRRSNYTIGLHSEVWISDVPRETDIQKRLDLGATDEVRKAVISRRSNVSQYLYDDMTNTKLPPNHFDLVTAIEVLEHVEADSAFLANVSKVLRDGGWFVMTTPNGDWIPAPFPDHKRHYKASDLRELLQRYFSDVKVYYRVNADGFFELGNRLGRVTGLLAYGANALLERIGFGGEGPSQKHHLVAICRK